MAKDLQDKLAQAKAYCNLGLAHKALGEYTKAEECQRYLLSVAQALDNTQVAALTSLTPSPSLKQEVDVNKCVDHAGSFQGVREPRGCVCVSG